MGEPKLITWLTMSPASKETCEPGSALREAGAQLLAQRFAARRAGLERDLDDGFLRPAGEQVDQVDRDSWRARRPRNRW